MSVVALGDLLFGDLLTEINLKPWWEKMRGYVFAASVAFALSATYLTLNGITLQCLPIENGNISYTCEYGLRQAAWTNSYCSNRLPWFINYFGSLCLLTVIILLFVSSYWLHKPKVIDSFITFVDMEKKISELNMTSEDLLKGSCQPLRKRSEDEKHLKLREVCDELWKGGRTLDLQNTYLRRCVLLIACSIISAIFFIVIQGFMVEAGDRFHCEIHDEDKVLIQGSHIFPTQFLCVAQMAYRFIGFNVVFVASILMQIAPIFWGWQKIDKQKVRLTNNTNIDFMRFFWKYARPTQSKKFSRLLKHVCGNTAVDAIEQNLSEAIKMEDFGLVRTFVLLPACKFESADQEAARKRKRGSLLIKTMLEIYRHALENWEADNNSSATTADGSVRLDETENIIKEACECLPIETPQERYEAFLSTTVERRRWSLLATILHQYVSKHNVSDGYNLLNRLKLNYDILNDRYRSFLSYACHERYKLTLHPIVKRLNRKCKEWLKLYVHEKGLSFHISNKINLDETDDSNITEDGTFNSPNEDNQEIAVHLETFRSILSGNGQYLKDLDDLNMKLSKVKFQKWNHNAKEMLELSHKQEFTRLNTFTCLLNCYVIPESERNVTGRLFCGDYDVDDISLNTVLHNSQVHGNTFVPTAARHIIACLPSDKRQACIKTVRFSSLTTEEKNDLIKFIDKCNATDQISKMPSNNARNPGENQSNVDVKSNNSDNILPQGVATSQEARSNDFRINMDSSSSSEDKPLLHNH